MGIPLEEAIKLIVSGGSIMTAAQAAQVESSVGPLVGSGPGGSGDILPRKDSPAMTDRLPDSSELEKTEEVVLDPRNLDAERHALELKFGELLDQDDTESLRELAVGLNPGDLSEILRPMNVEDTARILRMLPPDPLAEVLAEIDNRSLSALFTLLDIDEIADIIEEMPSDEAADLIGELDTDQAAEVLAAMEEAERTEVADLLQYPPETAGGLMGKEFATCDEPAICRPSHRRSAADG